MKPIIGIIGRKSQSFTGKDIDIVYLDIEKKIYENGGIPLVINNLYFNDYLDICDGFILQGGDDIDKNNLNIIKVLFDRDIPLLGICLGMQEMGICYNGIEFEVENHLNTNHDIIINKNSLLYDIVKADKIRVNSRHKWCIKETNLYVSAKDKNNLIEAIEGKNKLFFLGMQWHPENLDDIYSKRIFTYFVKACIIYKANKKS